MKICDAAIDPNACMTPCGPVQRRRRRSIDQSEAGPISTQRNAEEANLKRLDFSQEIRNADLPDKRKEELLEFDDRIRDQRTS